MASSQPSAAGVRLYDDEAELLMSSDQFPDKVSLLPVQATHAGGAAAGVGGGAGSERVRVLWGQDLLADALAGRYRAVVCGVNDEDNSHGIIAQLVEQAPSSQWSARTLTSFAKLFHDSVSLHGGGGREPYILKYDLDSFLVLALLRPRGRGHFTLEDLSRGFATITKMLSGRRDRLPIASVSFLNARVNRLKGADGAEPSFESVLRTMFEAGFRGDVYPAPALWGKGTVGVFPSYPFPPGLERMRAGGF